MAGRGKLDGMVGSRGAWGTGWPKAKVAEQCGEEGRAVAMTLEALVGMKLESQRQPVLPAPLPPPPLFYLNPRQGAFLPMLNCRFK